MNTQKIEGSGISINDFKNLPNKTTARNTEKINRSETDQFAAHSEELNVGKYNAKGKVEGPVTSKYHVVLAIQKQIDAQVKELTQHYKKIFESSETGKNAQKSLKTYFDENPEDLEKIEQGEIPEYWNQENTAKRIFDIAVQGYEDGDDKEAFYEKTVKMVKQAYSEVEEMVGGLPDLVIDTKNAVLKGLEEFRDGKARGDISFA